MKFAERRPFSASDDAENGSKIANRNSLWVVITAITLFIKVIFTANYNEAACSELIGLPSRLYRLFCIYPTQASLNVVV